MDLLDLIGWELPLGMPKLDRLGIVERDPEARGQLLGKNAPSEGKHPGPLDATVSNQRDIGRAAADVDKDPAEVVDLVGGGAARHRVRFRDGCDQLQVELRSDRLQRADVGQRRKGVEDSDHHLLALEVDRVVHGETVDAHAGDGGVDQLDVDVRNPELEAH